MCVRFSVLAAPAPADAGCLGLTMPAVSLVSQNFASSHAFLSVKFCFLSLAEEHSALARVARWFARRGWYALRHRLGAAGRPVASATAASASASIPQGAGRQSVAAARQCECASSQHADAMAALHAGSSAPVLCFECAIRRVLDVDAVPSQCFHEMMQFM